MRPALALLPLAACAPAEAPSPGDVAFDALSAAPVEAQPSVLRVSWTQDGPAELAVAWSVEPGVWSTSPLRALDAGAHDELILGAPYGSTVTWRLVDAGGAALVPDGVTANGPAPEDLPAVEVLVPDQGGGDAQGAPWLFVSVAPGAFGDPWWRLVYDRAGRVVWANLSAPGRASLHPRVALDGASLYLDQNSFWSLFDAGAASTVEQTLLDGTVVHTFATPGLHHPFTDLPDGGLAYGAVDGIYSDEVLTQVDRDGTTTALWDCQDLLGELGVHDRCGSNALTHDAARGTFLYSFYSFEAVVEIDCASGATRRWFGHLPGSPAFVPAESAFWWQHGASWTPQGTLLLSTDRTDAGEETVVREYRVDADALTEVWSFGEGEGLYGGQMGEAVRLPNGNTWHNYGQLPRLREVTPEGEVVWDLAWDATAVGRTMPIVDLYAMAGERR